jgi:hypothetical protein
VVPGGTLVDEDILSGHPVFLEVNYEAEVGGFDKTASGGRVRQQVGEHVAVGGTYVRDELEGGEYELQGVDAEVRLGRNSRIVAEYAESAGADSVTYVSDNGGLTYREVVVGGIQDGKAWKAAADLDVGEWFGDPDRYVVRLYAKELDSGFFSSGNFLEQGTRKAGVNATARFTGRDTIRLRHDVEERLDVDPLAPDATAESTISAVQWEHQRNRWGVTLEYFASETKDAAGDSLRDSSYGAARFWSRFTEKLTGRLDHQHTLSGPDNDQTTLALRFQALGPLAVEVEGTDGDRGSSAQLGALLDFGPSKIYLTERLTEDQAGRTTSTILGARSPIGSSTQAYTEYQWEDTERGKRTVSLLGLQRQWKLEPGVELRLSGERADVSAAGEESERSAVAASVSYTNTDDLRLFSRNEVRLDEGSRSLVQFLTATRFDYRLDDNFTLQVNFRYSKTEDRDTDEIEARIDERVIGVAYRPVRNDRFNALARYTRLADLRPLSFGGLQRSDRAMDVFSVETAYDVTRRLEWFAKGAARRQTERIGDMPELETDTFLVVQRFNYNVYKPIDVGVEYRWLGQRQTDDQREGFAAEVAWRLRKHVRFGLGYNFTDFSDNEFSQNDYSVRGWFLRIQGMY